MPLEPIAELDELRLTVVVDNETDTLSSVDDGVPQSPENVEDVDEALFDRIMAVNVKGVWLGAKYAMPPMKKQRRGVFLITASTAAIRPRPGVQAYAASKGAVVTLTKSLAKIRPCSSRFRCLLRSPPTNLDGDETEPQYPQATCSLGSSKRGKFEKENYDAV